MVIFGDLPGLVEVRVCYQDWSVTKDGGGRSSRTRSDGFWFRCFCRGSSALSGVNAHFLQPGGSRTPLPLLRRKQTGLERLRPVRVRVRARTDQCEEIEGRFSTTGVGLRIVHFEGEFALARDTTVIFSSLTHARAHTHTGPNQNY